MKMAPKDALSRASMGCKYAKRHHKVMTEKKVSLTPVRMQVRVKLDLHDLRAADRPGSGKGLKT